MYLRKLQKLAKRDIGLDLHSYKEYLNNLAVFRRLNANFDVELKKEEEAVAEVRVGAGEKAIVETGPHSNLDRIRQNVLRFLIEEI